MVSITQLVRILHRERYGILLSMPDVYPCGTGRAEPAFTTKGFRDRKHATGHKGALMEHSRSFTHRSAVVSWEQHSFNTKQGTTIKRRLDKLGHRVIQENRHYLKTVAEVILLCAQAELPLRGHDESKSSLNPGNFMMMLKMISNHDVLVKKYLETAPGNARYTSPAIQNELLGIMSDIVQKKISAEIQEAGYHTVMADESKDVSKKEQLSIVLDTFSRVMYMNASWVLLPLRASMLHLFLIISIRLSLNTDSHSNSVWDSVMTVQQS